MDEPQAQLDRENQLHVLHCGAPRSWTYSRIGLNGEVLAHSTFYETKTRPRLFHSAEGEVVVKGGMSEETAPRPATATRPAPKLSDRPPAPPRQ
jgi:hypothetical protein